MLQRGAVGIIPTDTLYGIVCQLSNQSAVEKIYDLKNRDLTKPVGTIMIAEAEQIDHMVNARDLLAAEVYWPGPTSVILELGSVLSYAHRGKNSLPFRVPDSTVLQDVLRRTGPFATTSANIAGHSPAATIQDALAVFRENVDFYVDGGDLSGNRASRIVEIKHGIIKTIRE